MPAITLPETGQKSRADEDMLLDRPWVVIGLNNNRTTFDQVILALQKSTGCSLEKAHAIAIEIDTKGEAVCYRGELERCEVVQMALDEIKLQNRLERE
ncbi:MAG TPA: ATP-dependent Clp protease adaptor ClpS [Armatimonadota bacterium]